MKPGEIKITEDRTADFLSMIDKFKNDKVLVGIPEDKSPRRDSLGINNATLLFINNFGSPVNNIPPRPVMDIGIFNAQDAVAEEFKNAAVKSLEEGSPEPFYERAGIIASNSIKRAINDQIGIEPPADSTLKSRKSKGFKGTKSLVVTGQMRNAITYVVKEG